MTQYLSQLSLARLLAASLLLGIGLGLVYDLFRIRRLAFGKRKTSQSRASRTFTLLDRLLLHGEDLLFGLIAGIATAILYFALSMGRLRLMAIIGEGVGFLLYRATLGKLVIACADSLLRLIAWLFRLLLRLFILPPLRLLLRLISAVIGLVRRRWAYRKRKRLIRMGCKEAQVYTQALRRSAASGFAEDAHLNQKIIQKTKHKKVNEG